MKFQIKRKNKGDGKTFSAEALISTLELSHSWINRALALLIYDGFEKGEPIDEFEFEINIKANGKEMTDEQYNEIASNYPKILGLTREGLLNLLKDDKEL